MSPSAPRRRRKADQAREIGSYEHKGEQRTNNPPQGLAAKDLSYPEKAVYHHDPHIDPSLSWAGKVEGVSFEVDTRSLHLHERIDPSTIISAVGKPRKEGAPVQPPLFEQMEECLPLPQALEFYRHSHGWSNRLIAGDSLLVMNSLLVKENLGSKVQMAYIDPPYGIRYGSNFQPFVGRHEGRDDRDEDLTSEPEMLKAFRDTWSLGVHSWLSYLRDRLLLVRDLLTASGSVFVQIGDENVHRAALVLDDVFGSENKMATISYATTSGSSTRYLPCVSDYLLWYAKDRAKVKYRRLYEPLTRADIINLFSWHAMVELPNGESRKPTPEERFDPDRYLPKGARIYQYRSIDSQGESTTGRSEPYAFEGRVYECPKGRQWSVSKDALDTLAKMGRLEVLPERQSLGWKKYENEVPGRRINNLWSAQMSANDKSYVVQTANKVIERCLLMTTDPGDLVLDPTCGSGTTAEVAERWGRRWITVDSSKVALAIARKRLMTSLYDYYELAHPDEGVGSGFVYDKVSDVSPSALALGEGSKTIHLYDKPGVDKSKARVTGPFTVEALPAPTVHSIDHLDPKNPTPPPEKFAPPPAPNPDVSLARSGETRRQHEWQAELEKTGIRGKSGQRLRFAGLSLRPGRRLHAQGEILAPSSFVDDLSEDRIPDKLEEEAPAWGGVARAVVSFGPEYAPLDSKQVEQAIFEAEKLVPRPKVVVFAAFQFDPEAAEIIDKTDWPGTNLLRVSMNPDILTTDLKKKRTVDDSFWLIGQPDIELERIPKTPEKDAGEYRVRVLGFDYYDIKTGKRVSGEATNIAIWMLDTDYDGRSLYPRQVFFPLDDARKGWKRLAKSLRSEIDQERIKAFSGTVSLPFVAGENRRAAVKIIDDRAIESVKLIDLD